jgi:hypothetical protein
VVEKLTAAKLPPAEVQLCIRVLMGKQGCSDAECLGQLNQAYMTNIGISQLGQLLVVKLHRELRDAELTKKMETSPVEPKPGCCCTIS